MISRSANSSSRKGSTASSVGGPPKLSITIPVLIRRRSAEFRLTGGAPVGSAAICLFTDQSSLGGEPGQARDRANSKLTHHGFPVSLDCAVADSQRRRDLLVAQPPPHSPEDFAPARGERSKVAALLLPLELPPHCSSQSRGNRRAEERFPFLHCPNRPAPACGWG